MKKSVKIIFVVGIILSLIFLMFLMANPNNIQNWTSLTPGTDTGIKFGNSWAHSVAYGNGTWIVVGIGGNASYSTNGIDWTSLPAGDDTGIKFGTTTAYSVAYGNGTWVVVGNSGKASYSTNGIDWTSLTAGDDTGIKFGKDLPMGVDFAFSVAYGNGIWVVVGESGKASYSTNGTNWTRLPAGTDTGIKFGTTWRDDRATSVTYGNGTWVVVGRGKASYSTNGTNWTSLTAGDDTGIKFGTSTFAYSVAYGNGTWVVVGESGKSSYSTNGTNWTSLTAGDDTGIKFGTTLALSVAYGNETWVVVGGDGKSSHSTNGTNWTSLIAGDDTGIKFGTTFARSVAYGNGTWVVVGSDGKASYSLIIDTIAPLLEITSPANNTNSSNSNLNVNFTVFDENLEKCWYSNDTYTYNYTLANCVNITSVTWSEGQHNVTIWANDSSNNVNHTSVTFNIDLTAPIISLSSSSATQNSLTFNIEITKDGSGINSVCSVETIGRSGVKPVISGTGKSQTVTETGLGCGSSYKYKVTCSDVAGNLGISVETSFSTLSCGGGSSGGGSGGTSPIQKQTWSEINPEIPAKINIDKEEIGLTKIEINVNEVVKGVSLEVSGSEKPKETDLKIAVGSDKKRKNVYQACAIDLAGLNNSQIVNVSFGFKVEKEWLDEKGGVGQTRLYRKSGEGNQWESLETKFIDEDEDYYYFESVSSGFSIFVVVIELATCNEDGICDEEYGEDSENCPEDCEPVLEEQINFLKQPFVWIVGILILSVVFVIVILVKKFRE